VRKTASNSTAPRSVRGPDSHDAGSASTASSAMHHRLTAGHAALANVIEFVQQKTKSDPNAVFGGSVPYRNVIATEPKDLYLARPFHSLARFSCLKRALRSRE